MKMTERIKRNMQPDKPMTLISLRLPDHIIEDLKEVAPSVGFEGYQALIRAYISNGLRKHLAEREAQREKDSTVEEFSQRLVAHGVPEQAIQEAVAEMRAAK
jgi:Arc/MetJ-type ribon-helix-helix transcriptional regulator